MASNIPQPKSYEQILSILLSGYASKTGGNDFVLGSANLSLFEVVALIAARTSGDVFQILKDFSLDRATGEALKRLAKEFGILPKSAKVATGFVSIDDTSFTKISTKIYAGGNPPNAGSTTIFVSDASQFPNSGNLYIGRGTNNVEGPIPYSGVTPIGSFFSITLTSPTSKFHNISESVILAQGGNRTIQANTTVLTPGTGSTPDIKFSTTQSATILDGETEVTSVPVTAQSPGSAGNVPGGSVTQFSTGPFTGATVTNPNAFTTGQDSETDDQLRTRIKAALASTGLGTATAIKSALDGQSASDENATIVATDISTGATGATVYVDDGGLYEAKVAGVSSESIVNSALGGEKFFQLTTGGQQSPVAKAFLKTVNSSPFNVSGGDTLAVTVGNITYQHVFASTDFISQGGATAYEITASINANTTLGFEAVTSGGGLNVVIRAKSEANDSIQVVTPTSGVDAGTELGFPSNQAQTLRLYKNKIPLSKDGNTASIFSQSQALWSSSIANGDTLILSVDGTAPVTYTILDSDFQSFGTYTTVSFSNSLDSWAAVLNAKLTGVTVTVVEEKLEISSNLGASDRAAVIIDQASTLVTKGMFSSSDLSSFGKASDYILDRNTAQFELVTPLSKGDVLSAGTSDTEARVEGSQISSGGVTLSSDGHIWILIDTPGTVIGTGVVSNSLLSWQKPATNIIRYVSSVSSAFVNVAVGDYMILWSQEVDSSVRFEGRVHAVTNTTLDIQVTNSEWTAATTSAGVIYQKGLSILRSNLTPQKFKIPTGTLTLDNIAILLNAQTESLQFSVKTEQFMVVKSNTKDTSGRVLIVTADDQGSLLGLASGQLGTSQDSLIAFYDSSSAYGQFPLFAHSSIVTGVHADPIDNYISSFDSVINFSSRDPNELISVLHPYGVIKDAQPFGEIVQETSLTGATIGIANENDIRRLRTVDRFFLANPLDFGHQDSAVVIFDNNSAGESYDIPFYRRALTNTSFPPSNSGFNAYDVDSGVTANFLAAFGAFDFSNFKVLMQAKKTVKPTPTKTALLYRSTPWGRSGEKINVAYVYPSSNNSPIGSTVVVTENVAITISLKSGATVVSQHDASTQWNVTVAANTPSAGIDQVTYTYSGVGTAPNLILNGGEYVNIGTETGFLPQNTGIWRISTAGGFTPTSTKFSVQMPNGRATAQSGAITTVASGLHFYDKSATTAADINTYVNANLSQYVSSTIVLDGDSSGSGTIVLSTYEDSGFTTPSIYLLDGINWIASSNLAGNPQFTFKKPLALPSDVGYAFNNAEGIRIIPTTMDQIVRLISILAVSGFTTVGTTDMVDRGSRLEIATQTIGSEGATQVIGGTANGYSVPILDTAARLDNQMSIVSVDNVASAGVHSDQWFRLAASNVQAKDVGLSTNTDITVLGGNPTTGEATIKLSGQALDQRYFGNPRYHVRVQGNTFRIEKQGSLVCMSWNGVGTSPGFLLSAVQFDDAASTTLNVEKINGSSEVDYIILTGNTNFRGLTLGETVTIANMSAANNGTFLVQGVSADGKVLRVVNPIGVNQFSSGSFTFTGNSTAGDQFTVGATTFTAGSGGFTIGGTSQQTAATLASLIATIPNISAVANGNVVTITAQFASANIALTYSGTAVVNVSGAALAGTSAPTGTFSASTQVAEGDSMIIGSPFAVLNRGTFRVIRRFNDSVWFENANVVEEEVTLPANTISLGTDATSSLMINASNHSQKLIWNGVGTEPHFENAKVGDVLTFGTDFAVANRGSFMVLQSGAKQSQITQFTMPAGPQFTLGGAGKYFRLNNGGNITQYYIWFNVNGGNSDPAPGGGLIGVEVDILSGDTSINVAAKGALAITGGTTGLTASASGSILTVTTVGMQPTNDPFNVNVPSPFAVTVVQEGFRTFLECVNPNAINEGAVFVTGSVLTNNRPQMQFYPYEATIPGDLFVVVGSVLGSTNPGSYSILQVLNQNTAIVSGNLASASNVSLLGNESSVLVKEGIPYTGYKQVFLVAAQPGSITRNNLVFNTNAQFEKISQSGGVEMTSIGKVDFPTMVKAGIDSYSYNTGLIGLANRIIYGDPRFPETYPGVGAAGADIFVREPLFLRIQISLDIRTQSGVSFPQISNQIRSSVYSLINSNDIGQDIDLSSIVETVRQIPGVKSVVITAPNYNVNNDIINLTTGQKALIVDQSTDISISLINS